MTLLKTDFPEAGGRSVLNKFYTVPDGIWGNVLYVHHSGSSTGPGFSPSSAYSTIKLALAACADDNNDLVIVLPGHAETITAASGVDFVKTGCTVIGLGQGTNRPTLTFGTATTASIDFSVANCTLKNIRCVSNVDSLAAFVEGGAGNATIEGCDFLGASAKEVLTCITIPTTFDDWTIRNCRFINNTDPAGTNGAAGTGAIYIVDSENVTIEGCYFQGGFETAFIHNKTTGAANLWVRDCYGNLTTATTDAVPFVLPAGASGGAVRCMLINQNETQVTEATLSGTFGAAFFNFQTFYGNDGGGGQLAVAGQAAAT